MAKKPQVTLPGSIKNIVHSVQNPESATNVGATKKEQIQSDNAAAANAAASAVMQPSATKKENVQPADTKDRTAPAAKKLPKAEGKDLAKEYTIRKESGEESWQLFLDLAKEYKLRDSKLATVYIDSDLKHILDRLKSANSIKMPSTALLSAIVARFVFDHEQDIKNAIYGDRLL